MTTVCGFHLLQCEHGSSTASAVRSLEHCARNCAKSAGAQASAKAVALTSLSCHNIRHATKRRAFTSSVSQSPGWVPFSQVSRKANGFWLYLRFLVLLRHCPTRDGNSVRNLDLPWPGPAKTRNKGCLCLSLSTPLLS